MKSSQILSITIALSSQSLIDAGEQSKHKWVIEVQAGKPVYPLGEAINIRVLYSNISDRSWKLDKPESSEGVTVNCRLVGKDEGVRISSSFSKRTVSVVKLPDGRTERIDIMAPRTEIEIKPGEKHEFEIDLYSRWTGDLIPGRYEAWIADSGQSLKSDKCEFSVVFSKESVSALLTTAAKEEEITPKRKWAVKCLQKLKPDFVLRFKGEKDSPETVKRISEDNAKAIHEFKEFWAKVKDTKAIEKAFSRSDPKADSKPERVGPK